ncbi:MAG: hypothetical protein UT09_C0007G0015 [Parcubacteria group bacterium GW2011_GWF2_38_8]|nr:MAG: hypothetical protein UT09_C0007G0015 [Parcubacteria group bacterium GW2011_GWF2_38_8]
MSFAVQTKAKTEEAAVFLASSILKQLNSGKQVLFFVTGGSSMAVAVRTAELLREHPHQNLTVTLTDERYGPIDHFNSNYFQLMEKGFDLPQAKMIPILIDDDQNITTEKFNTVLREELGKREYKIGLFGIGTDGHIAGILPESAAMNSENFACAYDTPVFSRITITPKVIEQLDEAVAYAKGEEKQEALKNLEKDIEASKQPAQILKKIPLLTIFTDM